MSIKARLTAKEVYFLAKCMGAKYLDYYYFAAMSDIEKRYTLHEQQALESLEEKEIIEEDFSGNIEIPDEVIRLFEPVFFGKKESMLNNGEIHRIHILGSRLTISSPDQGEFLFFEASDEDLEKLLKGTVQIECSDIDSGVSRKVFSGEQLMQEKYRKEAIRLCRGGV